jgi:hypothetical protein
MFLLMLRVDDRVDQVDKSYPLILGSFFWTLQTSKYFKLLTFSHPQYRGQVALVVKTERHLFLGKRIITLSHAVHIRLSAAEHTRSHHFSLLPNNLLLSHLLLAAPHPLLT